MLPCKLIYHAGYDLHLHAHVFPSQKYRLVREALLREGLAEAPDFLEPAPATDEDILRAHSAEYLAKLESGELSWEERARLEIPFNAEVLSAFLLASGGSILAAQRAVADGRAANIGGGFHHACSDHGEGFCVLNDVAVAIRNLQAGGNIRTALVVDTDVHQGNGTAEIFAADETVFTLSAHQHSLYPQPKAQSDIDVDLPDAIGDADYLAILERHLVMAFEHFAPDLLVYVAGADPYCEDQLGGLALTMEGLRQRDLLVFDFARRHGVAVAVTLAGGYASRVEDTVRVHVNTIIALCE